MRFETKFDRWIVGLLVFEAAISVVIPAAILLTAAEPNRPPFWCAILPWLILGLRANLHAAAVLRSAVGGIVHSPRLAQDPDTLCPPVGIQSASNTRRAAVFSTDRLLITTREGKCYVIAPAKQRQFLDEMSRKTLLERIGSGIGLLLSPLMDI
jgi:hypothetical protein